MALIRAERATKHFGGEQSIIDAITRKDPNPLRAVDGVSLEVNEGEIVGIAGESGCGKTTLGKLLLRLHEPTTGEIYFDGHPYSDMSAADEKEFRRRVQMIFQDPFESLNPRFTVQDTVREPLQINDVGDSYQERQELVAQALEDAGLSPAQQYMERFPRELSGGEQQRVAIARAMVIDPDFVVADEPVSMLDVSIRAGVLNLMKELRQERNLTYVFISHDLALIRYMCDKTAIMYLGDVVEFGETEEVITNPQHPYTRALLDAVPVPEPQGGRNRARIRGEIPSAEDPPTGCKFHPRCPHAREFCANNDPPELDLETGGYATCYRVDETHEYWDSPALEHAEEADAPPTQ
ncbi:MAG: ABC transporter ATP-binding protein [Halobacteriales archaeon]